MLIPERDADIIAAILDQCDYILDILQRIHEDKSIYDADRVYRDAIKMNLFQIGELTHKLSDEFKDDKNNIPWHKIYGARNIIAHGYLKVDDDIIWETCLTDIPFLKSELESM